MANVFLVRYPESPIRVPDKGNVSIGRADTNTIVLTEPRVSRQHALIEWQESSKSFVISDLGSRNGTYLNSSRIVPENTYPINDWNKIRIASSVFTVRAVDNPAIIKNEFKELREKVFTNVTQAINISEMMAEEQKPGLSGDLEHLCPVELFQMLETGRKTGTLTMKTDTGEGTYIFRQGNVTNAKFGHMDGEKAVFEVLKFNRGAFAFVRQDAIHEIPMISISTTMLLMEGCRIMDEGNASIQHDRNTE